MGDNSHDAPQFCRDVEITLDGLPVELPAGHRSLSAIRCYLETLALERQRILCSLSVDGEPVNLALPVNRYGTFCRVDAGTAALKETSLLLLKTVFSYGLLWGILFFNGLLPVRRTFQIGQKKEPVNRREERVDSQCEKHVTDQNQRPVSKSAGGAISQHLAFREHVQEGHQVVVGTHGLSAMFAKPRGGRLFESNSEGKPPSLPVRIIFAQHRRPKDPV